MTDISRFFISSAMAQQAAPAAMPMAAGNNPLMGYIPFLLIFGVFWFLVIRPQQQKFDIQAKMVKALQRGDRIVTSGGIHGKITRIENDTVIIVEIANGVEIQLDRSSVQSIEAKTQPVLEADKK